MDNNVVCIGELLVDFVCSDVDTDLSRGTNFVKKAGGAPANVAAAISKLGGHSLFAGKVGMDSFGIFLKDTLDKAGVNLSMLSMDKENKTTISFVSLKSDGQRDFIFYRGADEDYRYEELDKVKLFDSNIIHFGSATAFLGGPLEDTYMRVATEARARGITTSFDPNFRDNLWGGRISEFVKKSRNFIRLADIVKLSEDELFIITGFDDLHKGVDFAHSLGASAVFVTLGSEGSYVSNGNKRVLVESIPVKALDSTGAGDGFVGGMLYCLSQYHETRRIIQDFNQLVEIAKFSNRVGALTCTKLGAIDSLPSLDEVMNIGR